MFEPNYTTNRGYALDDVRDMTLDDVEAAIYDEQLRGLNHLLDAANAERDLASGIIERLQTENEQLLSLLASKGVGAGAALDSAGIMPFVLPGGGGERIARDAAAFRAAVLPRFLEPAPEATTESPIVSRILSRFNR